MDTLFKVFVTDIVWPTLEEELQVLEPVGAVLEYMPAYSQEVLLERVTEADAILTCWHQIPEAALHAAHKCKVIGRYGIGVDNIPVALATELGILVTNVPDFCLDELTDQVMAYVLAFARQLPVLDARVKSGQWDRTTDFPIRRLRGQVLGLIGFGHTARTLVPKAQAFGLQVQVYTPRLQANRLPPDVTQATSLEELLARADYVSIHTPLTAETRGLLGARAFRTMKSSAVLINTARGPIVDEAALHEALNRNEIAGAALDVLCHEPPVKPIPWRMHPNVLLTPHSAFYSLEALQELARKGARNVSLVLQGKLPSHLVNPEVLTRPCCRVPRTPRS